MPAQGLYSAVRRKAYRKRTDGRLRWILGPGVELSVAVYVLLKRAKPGSGVAVHAATNEELIVESANICHDTGARRGALYSALKGWFPLAAFVVLPQVVDPMCPGPPVAVQAEDSQQCLSAEACPPGCAHIPRRDWGCCCIRGRAGAVMHDVPKRRFPKHPCRFEPVVFFKDDLRDLKCVQSPGAGLAILRVSRSCPRAHAALRPRCLQATTGRA